MALEFDTGKLNSDDWISFEQRLRPRKEEIMVTQTAEAEYGICPYCGDMVIKDEQHICTPFRYIDPKQVQLVKITDQLEMISGQLAQLIDILE